MSASLLADNNTSELGIRAYAPGCLTLINGETLQQSVIHTTQGERQDWRPQTMEQLREDDFLALKPHALDLIIIGTGAQQHLLSRPLKQAMDTLGIPYEVMSSTAAASTFNMMLIDERPTTLALLIQ